MGFEFKECPFCKRANLTPVVFFSRHDRASVAIRCMDCGGQGPCVFVDDDPTSVNPGMEEAVRLWNEREGEAGT